jgi:hypothetical protein
MAKVGLVIVRRGAGIAAAPDGNPRLCAAAMPRGKTGRRVVATRRRAC